MREKLPDIAGERLDLRVAQPFLEPLVGPGGRVDGTGGHQVIADGICGQGIEPAGTTAHGLLPARPVAGGAGLVKQLPAVDRFPGDSRRLRQAAKRQRDDDDSRPAQPGMLFMYCRFRRKGNNHAVSNKYMRPLRKNFNFEWRKSIFLLSIAG